MSDDASTMEVLQCLLCGHEGDEEDGELDNYGDWYCEVCCETAPTEEVPLSAH